MSREGGGARVAGVTRGSSEAAGQQKEMLETLHRRVTQHNILTIGASLPLRAGAFSVASSRRRACETGGYYARIQLSRLAQLLALPLDEAEKQLCEIVSDKSIYARVDRRACLDTASPRSTREGERGEPAVTSG